MEKADHRRRASKHRRRAAMAKAKANRTEETAKRYFLTLVKRPTKCQRCAGELRRGAEMVYRRTPKLVYCVSCAESLGVRWVPSMRWEQVKGDEMERGSGPHDTAHDTRVVAARAREA